jgi:hypothetical protein
VSLQGANELRRRLDAILKAPEQIQRKWAAATAPILRARIPVRRGVTRASVRVGSNNTVIGNAVVNFLDAGVKAHDITAKRGTLKFQVGSQTLFRKKVHKPRIAGRPIKKESARQGLEKLQPADQIIRLWNEAA